VTAQGRLIVYGDFNCPYSALASSRVDSLLAAGFDVEWRAVQHDASMPEEGLPVEGELKAELEREIDEVRGLLREGEAYGLPLPAVRPNTAQASRIYAAHPDDEHRRILYAWAWDPSPGIETTGEDADTAARWQREWDATEKKMVPMLVLPDGYISRGLGALKRLADMIADERAPSDTPA
jgi:hypothetical protein